eukprot:10502-Lingulodinium_polyedra.AAC.1
MARRRAGGGQGGGQGGGGRSRSSPSNGQLSAAGRKLDSLIQRYNSKFEALAARVDRTVPAGAGRGPDWSCQAC